jgi:hypothetical protein
MPQGQNLQKAKFVKVDGSGEFVCQFNPTDFSLTKEIKWKQLPKTGNAEPEVVFAGGQAKDLTISLLFDSTDTGNDVRDKYSALLELAEIDESKKDQKTGKSEPPRCRFEWGSFLRGGSQNALTGVIQSISQKFTMFKADGTPLRAEVSVSFVQTVQKPAAQNPTTRTEPRKIWVVHEGQTLDWIAYQEYGNPAYWRHIAETNNLANPLDLKPGQVLKLVPLP